MVVNARDLGLDKLPTEDKVALINELWADVVPEERLEPSSQEVVMRIDVRIAEYEAKLNQLHTLEEVVTTLKADREA